jgi:hypothetical protein
MKFKVGDKIRCINDYLPDLIFGEVYTVAQYSPNYDASLIMMFDTIKLVETGTNWWSETRFELESTPQPYRPVPFSGQQLDLLPFTSEMMPTCPIIHGLKTCECGVDSIGGGKHSSYCPKAN